MKKCLLVYLHEIYVGKLCYTEGQLSFCYDPQYLQQVDARPLSSSMPLRQEEFLHPVVAAFFSGLLPDEGVRQRLAKYLHLSDKNIFSLLEAIGGECAGAVSVKISEFAQENADDYLVLEDEQALDVMHSLEQRPFLVGEQDIRISAAGAQCKLMIAFIDGKLAIPKGHTPSTHIIKPNISGYAYTVENEFFCMRLAQRLGLTTPKVEILKLIDERFYLVERYDRILQDKKIKRLHQEDFCQILNIPPEIKYENEGGPSLKSCFKVMDDFIRQGQMPGMDKLRLLKLVIFNFLIGNTDAHGKNFSILYPHQGVRLAPCYDLLSTMVYSNQFKDKMAMKIGGQYENTFIQPKNWEKLALEIGFKPLFLTKLLGNMAEQVLREAQLLAEGLDDCPIYPKILAVIQQQVKKVNEA